MVLCAVLGSASAYAESTLAQVFKTRHEGEHRGGMPWYVEKGLKLRWLAVVLATMTLLGYGFVFPGVQSNNIASSVDNAFSIPTWVTAVVVTALLALVILGGTQRIVRVAEWTVPFMALAYIIGAVVILVLNVDQILPAIRLVLGSALGVDQVFGGIVGAAVAWGVRRAVFSNVAGVGEGTYGSASASVSHPSKQGIVQAFSIFIDTVVVCNATGIMIIVTGMYNVSDGSGGFLFEGAPGLQAGPANTQAAIDTVWPGGGPGFVAVALFFFAFTTLIAFYYIATTNLVYLRGGRSLGAWSWVLKVGMLTITFYGAVESADVIWAIGDIGYGSIGWVNMICILLLCKVVHKVTQDYERQKKAGIDPVFDPRPLGIEGAEFWVDPKATWGHPAVTTAQRGEGRTGDGGARVRGSRDD